MLIKRIKTNIKGVFLSFAAFVVALSGVAAMGVMNSAPAAAAGASDCGSGSYVLRGTHPISAGAARYGTLEIYWSNTNQNNCAIARCYQDGCGYGIFRDVKIKRSGDSSWNARDYGWDYAYYAGPVKSWRSAGRCIDVDAVIKSGYTYSAKSLRNAYCS